MAISLTIDGAQVALKKEKKKKKEKRHHNRFSCCSLEVVEITSFPPF